MRLNLFISPDPFRRCLARQPGVPNLFIRIVSVRIDLATYILCSRLMMQSTVVGILLLIMLLNLVGMLLVRPIIACVGMITFQVLGWIFAVLQGLSVISVQKVPLSKLLISLINTLDPDHKLLISINSQLSGGFSEFDAATVR
jgi:hypothetical protein